MKALLICAGLFLAVCVAFTAVGVLLAIYYFAGPLVGFVATIFAACVVVGAVA